MKRVFPNITAFSLILSNGVFQISGRIPSFRRLLSFSNDRVSGIAVGQNPAGYSLAQNLPNQVVGESKIKFSYPDPDHVQLTFFNPYRLLKDNKKESGIPAGSHPVFLKIMQLSHQPEVI